MNLLSSLLGLSLLALIFTQAVIFHYKTICRQKTWLEGVVSITRGLLSGPEKTERTWINECERSIFRHGTKATSGEIRLELHLRGKL